MHQHNFTISPVRWNFGGEGIQILNPNPYKAILHLQAQFRNLYLKSIQNSGQLKYNGSLVIWSIHKTFTGCLFGRNWHAHLYTSPVFFHWFGVKQTLKRGKLYSDFNRLFTMRSTNSYTLPLFLLFFLNGMVK